ncbi:TraB/GumN family protein [Pseudoduganella violaceinigra]|uniref:TraB/GumN family protein n=1 Tax=Pseudoduganella violaceinigra TaxID=246602 RepID=UPI00042A7448|nr:TraB/GumN family protein [Pseudoduganella violaceinigra]
MVKRIIAAAAFMLLAGAAWAQEEIPAPAADTEQVLIVGQRPGPGLWKVSKGEHVMYIFGDYAPLPIKMDWRSQEVESIIAKSQEYLPKPSFGISVGLWGGLKMLPYAVGFKNNPDGAKLVDVLPAETYDRWQVLKAKYIGKDSGIERERPMFVAETLYAQGLEKNGLTLRTDVYAKLDKLVKQYKVKITSSSAEVELENPGQAIKAFNNSPGSDTACFAKTVERLETDIDAMRVRANAWAVGDMSKIATLSFADRDEACKNAVFENDAFKSNEKLRQAEQNMRKAWLENAEHALEANNTTFAVLSLRHLFGSTGYLADLQAKGYKVEAPE